jgi:uncharacterized protein YraI
MTSFAISAQAGVTAEAGDQVNLRASPSTDAQLLGQMALGTRYPVIGRSEFFPWYLLGDPTSSQPIGWVFADIVTVQGEVSSVPLSTLDLNSATPAASITTPVSDFSSTAEVSAEPISTAAPASAVTGTVLGEINVRYGPGVEFPRIGVAREGDVLSITAWHTQLPWVEIDYPASPNGSAWVALDLLEIQGDLQSLPANTRLNFNLPTLTPTPSVLQQSTVLGGTPTALSPEFTALGDQLWNVMLSADFDPQTSRFGALFLLDLQTNEALVFGEQYAFSGISVNKIAILSEYYRLLNTPPADTQAYTVSQCMVCSDNIATNRLLAEIGGGNPYQGAEQVSAFLEQFGAERSFIYTPYADDPFITPQAPRTRTTSADQLSADPDLYNQMTVTETGALLNAMYQCGYHETGVFLEAFPDNFTPSECRQMLEVMSHNRIGSLIEMGLPEDVPIAHKHGWIADTTGDAALVFSPGGAYVLVVMLYDRTDWVYTEAKPVIEEISRQVYNYFNPDAPMSEVRAFDERAQGDVNACNQSLFGSQLIEDLMASEFAGYLPAPTESQS